MIKYQLICEADHTFESWFASSDAYDTLAANDTIACPTCASTNVRKAIMAPNVSPKTRKRGQDDAAKPIEPREAGKAVMQQPIAPAIPAPIAAMNPKAAEVVAEFIKAVRKVRSELVANADNVGDKFAEEARKIHYDEVAPRAIYGEATPEEAQELTEEGIDFVALPVLPEDRN